MASMRDQEPYSNTIIYPHMQIISESIRKHSILIIQASPNAGKTLTIPYYLVKAGNRVHVALPTEAKVAKAINAQKKNNINVVSSCIDTTTSTYVQYATVEYYIELILKTKSPGIVLGDVFIIDDIYEGVPEITYLMSLVSYLLRVAPQIKKKVSFILNTLVFIKPSIDCWFPKYCLLTLKDVKKHGVVDIFSSNNITSFTLILQKEMEIFRKSSFYFGTVYAEHKTTIDMIISAIRNIPGIIPVLSSHLPQNLETDMLYILIGNIEREPEKYPIPCGFIINAIQERTIYEGICEKNIPLVKIIRRKKWLGIFMEGRVYHLTTENKYNKLCHMPCNTNHKLFDKFVLQLIYAGIPPRDVLKKQDLEISFCELYKMKYITADNSLTKLGIIAARLPLSPQHSALVYWGLHSSSNYVRIGIIIVACMINVSTRYLIIPTKIKKESASEYTIRRNTWIRTKHNEFKGSSDLHTLINIFSKCMNDCKTNTLLTVKKWAIDNGVETKLSMAIDLISRISTIFSISINIPLYLCSQVIKNLSSIFNRVFADNIFTLTETGCYIHKYNRTPVIIRHNNGTMDAIERGMPLPENIIAGNVEVITIRGEIVYLISIISFI